jgi:hypothetical protein
LLNKNPYPLPLTAVKGALLNFPSLKKPDPLNDYQLSLGLNERESIGHSLEECAHLKSYLNLLHFFKFFLLLIFFARMNNGISIVLFELRVSLLEIIKDVEEAKAGEIVN